MTSRLRVLLAALLATLLAAPLLALLGAPAHALVDKDCGDFSTQLEAQNFYNSAGPGDPHDLDGADNDGRVCESLPCPCSGSTSGGGSTTTSTTVVKQKAYVYTIIDGDTLDVRLASNGSIVRVRMLGINTPERDQCGYTKATDKLKYLLPKGTTVQLVSDSTQSLKDKYGRLLRYVMKGGTQDINKAQLWLGMAKLYVNLDDPITRVDAYRAARNSARDNNRGLYAVCW